MEKFPARKPESVREKARTALRAAILAAIAATPSAGKAESIVDGLSSSAQRAIESQATPQLRNGPKRAHKSEAKAQHMSGFDAVSFRKALKRKEIGDAEFGRMEIAVMLDEVPLAQQLAYMTRMLEPRGRYFNELYDANLSAERFSIVMDILDRVSTRMNRDYGLRDAVPSDLPIFSHADEVVAATRPIQIESEKGSAYCNAFFSRGFDGRVYQDIAAHCGPMKGDLERAGFTVSDEGADVATRDIPEGQLASFGIAYPDRLPISVPGLSGADIVGMPALTYSVSPRGERKMHFSIMLPLTARVQELLGYAKRTDLATYSHDLLFMLKPEEEGYVIGKDEASGHVILNASGSSGSGVFIQVNGLLVRAGGFIEEQVLTPDTHFRYAVSIVSAPQSHSSVHRFRELIERSKADISEAAQRKAR